MKKTITTILLPLLIISCGKESSNSPETIVKTVLVKPDTKNSKEDKKEEVQKYFSQDISYTCDDSENCNEAIALVIDKELNFCTGVLSSKNKVLLSSSCFETKLDNLKQLEVKTLQGKIATVLKTRTAYEESNFKIIELTLDSNHGEFKFLERHDYKITNYETLSYSIKLVGISNVIQEINKCSITHESLHTPLSHSTKSSRQTLKDCKFNDSSIQIKGNRIFSFLVKHLEGLPLSISLNGNCIHKNLKCINDPGNLNRGILYKFINFLSNEGRTNQSTALKSIAFSNTNLQSHERKNAKINFQLDHNKLLIKDHICLKKTPLFLNIRNFSMSFDINIYGELINLENFEVEDNIFANTKFKYNLLLLPSKKNANLLKNSNFHFLNNAPLRKEKLIRINPNSRLESRLEGFFSDDISLIGDHLSVDLIKENETVEVERCTP